LFEPSLPMLQITGMVAVLGAASLMTAKIDSC